MPTTNVEREPDGKVKKGTVLNPEGVGGFQGRMEQRSDGRWQKEDSIPYQYNMLIRKTGEELAKWAKENPQTKRTVAQDLAYRAVLQAREDLGYLKEVTDRTAGKPTQPLDHAGEIGIGLGQVASELQNLYDTTRNKEDSSKKDSPKPVQKRKGRTVRANRRSS